MSKGQTRMAHIPHSSPIISLSSDEDEDQDLQQLATFWAKIEEESRTMPEREIKNHKFSLERVKTIMKKEEYVQRVRDEAAAVLGRAAEIFAQELGIRCWLAAEESCRMEVQLNDLALVVDNYQQFEFLIDIVPPSTKKRTNRWNKGLRN